MAQDFQTEERMSWMMCGKGRPLFRNYGAVQNEVRDVIDGDRLLTVREVAEKCGDSKKL